MEVLILQVFVSLILVGGSIGLFLFSAKQRDFDHADRLALLPVDEKEIHTKGTSHDGNE